MQPEKITLADALNIDQLYGPAMAITDPDPARIYFEALVERSMRFGNTRADAEQIERSNLGYFAGYSSFETRQRVERLFGAVHPYLGSTASGPLTVEEIVRIGYEAGQRVRREAAAK